MLYEVITIDDGNEIEKLTKRDAMSIARVYNMDYYDIDGALANNTATSDRSIDSRATQEVSTSTNVILNTDDAARVVAIVITSYSIHYTKLYDNLYFRMQRDRYEVEYLLKEGGINRIKKIGMNNKLRLQFLVES